MSEPESIQKTLHPEPLFPGRNGPATEEGDKRTDDWKGYSPETLLLLDD